MTIDEAIAHAREVAKKNREICRLKTRENAPSIFKCAEEHEQLAEWLEELKNYRNKNKMVVLIDCKNIDEIQLKIKEVYADGYNKAIDDFAEKLKPILNEKVKGWTNSDDLIRWCNNSVDELAEQLKGGESE